MNNEILKQRKKKSTDDLDIKKYVPDAPIIKYNQLKKYQKLTDILKNDKDCFFLLYQVVGENNGHWILCSRYGNTLEFFDPYGLKPDTELNWTKKQTLDNLGITHRDLVQLFNNCPDFEKVYSKTKYQKMSNDISTCGKHSILRAIKMKQGLDLPQYKKFMINTMKKNNLANFDDVVVSLIK